MATATDYLSNILRLYPKTKVGGGLTAELQRRASEGATMDQVLNDAAGYSEVAQGEEEAAKAAAAAQVDPGVRTSEADLANEKTLAETSGQRLKDEISRVYQQRRSNDPLAKLGIVSNAAQDVQANDEARQVKDVGTDLNNKLSYIAQRLGAVRSNAETQRSGIVSALKDQFSGERTNAQRQYVSDKQAAQDRQLALEDRSRSNALQAADVYLKFIQSDVPIDRETYERFRSLNP